MPTSRKKPARGRPPRADKAATERLEIRLTKLERADIEHKAALAGLSVSEWIRRALVGIDVHRGTLTADSFMRQMTQALDRQRTEGLSPAAIVHARLDLQRALEVSDRPCCKACGQVGVCDDRCPDRVRADLIRDGLLTPYRGPR